MANGLLIQWGSKELTSGSTNAYTPLYIMGVNISFSQSFKGASYYRIWGSSRFGTGAELPFGAMVTQQTASAATIRVWDITSRAVSSSMKLVIDWMAIGLWK